MTPAFPAFLLKEGVAGSALRGSGTARDPDLEPSLMETVEQENKSEVAWWVGGNCGKRAPSKVAARCPCAPLHRPR